MQFMMGAEGKQEVPDFFHNFQKGSEVKSPAPAKNCQALSLQYYFCNTSQLQPAGMGCFFNSFLVCIDKLKPWAMIPITKATVFKPC